MNNNIWVGIKRFFSKLIGISEHGNSSAEDRPIYYAANRQLENYYKIEYRENHLKPYQTSLSSRDRCFSLLGDRDSLRTTNFEPF